MSYRFTVDCLFRYSPCFLKEGEGGFARVFRLGSVKARNRNQILTVPIPSLFESLILNHHFQAYKALIHCHSCIKPCLKETCV